MKNAVKSFVSFTYKERIGIIGLSALLLALLIIRVTMVYRVPRHKTDDAEEQRLIAAWEVYKRSQPKSIVKEAVTDSINDYQDANDDNETPLPSIIDINTADSATLVRLRGIGPATAGKIVARRQQKGAYTDINQLLEVRSFPRDVFEMLKKHLVVIKPSK